MKTEVVMEMDSVLLVSSTLLQAMSGDTDEENAAR